MRRTLLYILSAIHVSGHSISCQLTRNLKCCPVGSLHSSVRRLNFWSLVYYCLRSGLFNCKMIISFVWPTGPSSVQVTGPFSDWSPIDLALDHGGQFRADVEVGDVPVVFKVSIEFGSEEMGCSGSQTKPTRGQRCMIMDG